MELAEAYQSEFRDTRGCLHRGSAVITRWRRQISLHDPLKGTSAGVLTLAPKQSAAPLPGMTGSPIQRWQSIAGTWCVSGDGKASNFGKITPCATSNSPYDQKLCLQSLIMELLIAGGHDGVSMKQRLFGGGISASPLLVNDNIYRNTIRNSLRDCGIAKRFDLVATNPSDSPSLQRRNH